MRTQPASPRDDLAAALGQFVIHSPTVFAFAGEAPVDARMAAPAPTASGNGDDPMLSAIRNRFYESCYARRRASAAATTAQGQANVQSGDPAFARRLVAANAGREYWDGGWVIHQFGP